MADDFVLLRTVRSVQGVFWPFGRNDLGQLGGSHFYRPLWVVWNRALYDLSHGPAFAHVANCVLFGLVCVEVAVLLRRLTGARSAVLGALAFAVLPAHAESVAWISGDTDLLAVAFALGALLAAVSDRPSARTYVAVGVLTAGAMLSKEVAVVLPALGAVVVWMRSVQSLETPSRRQWYSVIAIVVAVAAVGVGRSFVINGFGGYAGSALTPLRAAGSLGGFSLASVVPPQLMPLRHPLLFAVPAVMLAVVVGWVWHMWRRGDRAPVRLVAGGAVWFYVALIPVLNQPLNLNTYNGDRLLLLPSVGLAIGVAGLLRGTRSALALGAFTAVVAGWAVACVADASDWLTAGRESKRIIAELGTLASDRGDALVVLSVPSDYRAAHLFPDALADALELHLGRAVSITTCASVHMLALRPGQVSVQRLAQRRWLGIASSDALFNRSVFGGSIETDAGCPVAPASGSHSPLGTAERVVISPLTPAAQRARFVYFDGRDMLPVR